MSEKQDLRAALHTSKSHSPHQTPGRLTRAWLWAWAGEPCRKAKACTVPLHHATTASLPPLSSRLSDLAQIHLQGCVTAGEGIFHTEYYKSWSGFIAAPVSLPQFKYHLLPLCWESGFGSLPELPQHLVLVGAGCPQPLCAFYLWDLLLTWKLTVCSQPAAKLLSST